MPEPNPFGGLLRKSRKAAHKTLADLADHLHVTIAYISGIELGNRSPLSSEMIHKAGQFLHVDPRPLLVAAAEQRGRFELELNGAGPKALQVGAALMRGWPSFKDDDLQEIYRVIERRGQAKEDR
jgi:transcriptional regulator with XRE-family HTH domain